MPCTTNNSVVAWWRFDDSLAPGLDSAGGDNNGLLRGSAPPLWKDSLGILEDALKFNRSTSYLSITGVIDDNSTIAMEGWAKVNSSGFDQALVYRGDTTCSGSNRYYSLALDSSNRLSFSYRVGVPLGCGHGAEEEANTFSVTSPNPAPLNQWFHFAAVRWTGVSGAPLFQDGVKVASLTRTDNDARFGDWAGLDRPLVLGASFYPGVAPTSVLDGLLDEVVFYRGDLSQEVVLNNYCSVKALRITDPLPTLCQEN